MTLYFHRICTSICSPSSSVDDIDDTASGKGTIYTCPISENSSIETYVSRTILNYILKDGCFRFILYNKEDLYLLQKKTRDGDGKLPPTGESWNPVIDVVYIIALR